MRKSIKTRQEVKDVCGWKVSFSEYKKALHQRRRWDKIAERNYRRTLTTGDLPF